MSAVEDAAKALHASGNPSATPGMSCSECRHTANVLAEAGLLRADGETRTAARPRGREGGVLMDEQLYLVCECGEVFDTIETAAAHDAHVETGDEYLFVIKPESEAL